MYGAVCLKKGKSPRKIKTTAHIGHGHVRENTILHLWTAVIGAKVLQTTFSVENASNSLDLGLADNAMRENIAIVVDELRRSEPILGRLVAEGRLEIIGAVYDIENGGVDILNGKT